MKVHAYILFPEGEYAYQSLDNNPLFSNEVVSELFRIKKSLRKNTFSLFYDSKNVSDFIQIVNDFFPDQHPTIEKQLATFITTTSEDVNLPKLRSHRYVYANWSHDLNIKASPFVIAESIESIKKDSQTSKTVCISLGGSLQTDIEHLHAIRDFDQPEDPPEVVILPIVNDLPSFEKWKASFEEGRFLLERNAAFESINKRWKKEKIYREIATGYLWYFDFYHRENKIHFEVFDHTGEEHQGEANENGILDRSLKDPDKKISDCL